MPKEFSRTLRVAEQVRRELAELIRDEIRDPRVGLVSISGVEVSRDLAHAKVFFTVMDESARSDTQAALDRASGFLRRELGRRMIIRSVPQLHFHYDESIERGSRISAAIDAALADDAQHHTGDDEE